MRVLIILIGIVIALTSYSQAQVLETGHYGYALNGLRGAHLPAPGFYYTTINHIYTASQFRFNDGNVSEMNKSVMSFTNINLFAYTPKQKIFGAKYSAMLGIPITNLALSPVDLSVNTARLGIGDLFVLPVALEWQMKQVFVTARAGFFAPTGRFKAGANNNLGKGYLSHFYSVGATVYFDKEKRFHFSGINTYQFCGQQAGTGVTAGQTNTFEWGLGSTFDERFDFGVVGFFQFQTTPQTGGDPSLHRAFHQQNGFGWEMGYTTKSHFSFRMRNYFELLAINRPQGNAFRFVISYRF
ncbi:SphA family protein [Persicobacter psychrovividus]|uniref:Transporter n=1 Tax=Persicobacter psychrovividus TaxID=387638 RepID=A0ABM7VMA6_9BACT|nr:hypothetical protein PEPS_44310 [Persicobacter psychrovividus]